VIRGAHRPDAILDYAEDHEIDLIAMGTHGRSGIRRYIAGSVAERVVRRLKVPVLTVRKTERSRVDDGYDDVLVPVDGSDHAIAAADHAIAIAQLLDARIHAVHVVDVGAASTTPRVTPPTTLVEQLRTAGEVAIDAVTTRANDAGVDVTTAVHEGFPARDLLAYADDHDVDLIAMGTAGRTGLDRFLPREHGREADRARGDARPLRLRGRAVDGPVTRPTADHGLINRLVVVSPMSADSPVEMDDPERDEFLGNGGTGVISCRRRQTTRHTRSGVVRLRRDRDDVLLPAGDGRGRIEGEIDDRPVSFVTTGETDGWRSVVARGRLEDVESEGIATETLAGLDRVDIPLVDVFHRPLREVEFAFYRLRSRRVDVQGRIED